MTMDFTRPVGKASGIPWAGIENTPPEVQNLSKPEMAFLKLPFDPLEYIEHLDQLPFDPESGPALGNSAAPPESHSPEKREGATLLGHQQPVRMRVAWVRGKGILLSRCPFNHTPNCDKKALQSQENGAYTGGSGAVGAPDGAGVTGAGPA